MDIVILLKAVVMGIVEGLTEFLPISSTGHLILAGEVLAFTGEKAKVFEVFIQLGAILAVVWVYRAKVWAVLSGLFSGGENRRFAVSIGIAFFPAAAVGFLTHSLIKQYLFGPVTVAIALVAGGLAIFAIERMRHTNRYSDMMAITYTAALAVGLAQILALFPGVSRSGATIMGGLLAGMSRKAATEFSFFLAIPTMFIATLYDLLKSADLFTSGDIGILAVGFIMSFMSALWVVRWLIKFVSYHDFKPFAWYRVVFGGVLLVFYWLR